MRQIVRDLPKSPLRHPTLQPAITPPVGFLGNKGKTATRTAEAVSNDKALAALKPPGAGIL